MTDQCWNTELRLWIKLESPFPQGLQSNQIEIASMLDSKISLKKINPYKLRNTATTLPRISALSAGMGA